MSKHSDEGSPWWHEWRDLSDGGKLATKRPEEIVRVCRVLEDPLPERLKGALLNHLADLARTYLRMRVRQDLVDGGREVIEEVVEILNVAVLTQGAADGTGFETAFHVKLRQRLVDRIRASRRDSDVIAQETVDAATGATREAPDLHQLSPEDLVIIRDIIEKLPAGHRQAFQLHRLGFHYTSSNPNESIAVMLGKSSKTVQDWVEKAELQILQLLETKR